MEENNCDGNSNEVWLIVVVIVVKKMYTPFYSPVFLGHSESHDDLITRFGHYEKPLNADKRKLPFYMPD